MAPQFLHAKRGAQKRVTLTQHLRSSGGVLQLMIEVIPCDQVAFAASGLQTRRHSLRLLNVHVAVGSAVKEQHRRFDLLGVFSRGSRMNLRPVADELSLESCIGPTVPLSLEGR